jgi:hypothetical protein
MSADCGLLRRTLLAMLAAATTGVFGFLYFGMVDTAAPLAEAVVVLPYAEKRNENKGSYRWLRAGSCQFRHEQDRNTQIY